MPPRMIAHRATALALLAATAMNCTHHVPPPCSGEACRQWPHVELRFWRRQGPPNGQRYTGALCVQVSFDCPEEGRHEVWIEPQAPRCRPYLNYEGPEWLRVEQGRLSIPWPARCQGDHVEMYITAQPNFATCTAVNNELLSVSRTELRGDVVFDCR